MSQAPPHLVIIAGPTGAGKTALAVTVAERLGGEIVSADSQQVYRHFDIGTAKPSRAELERVPHHLVSVVEPTFPFSAAHFQRRADEAIADITARGKRVVVVGGTGLYVRVLLHGVVAAPGSDPSVRATLEALAREEGDAALHARLAVVDPPSAAALHVNDRVRVVRALEIATLTGRPASEWRQAHGFVPTRYPATLWVLDPDRDELYRRIDRRAEAMFAAGLVDEVRGLIAAGYRDTAPMRSVGYQEALGVAEGRLGQTEAIALTARATRRYAKRQWTWFRKEHGARFIRPPYAEVLE